MGIIRTQLKLFESKENGELIGFVSRHSKTGKLLGVREDAYYGKMVCVLAEHLKGTLKPNILYEVFLKPMHSGAGYVIVAAGRVVFPANIETSIVHRYLYNITITFGNRVIFFDPICGKTSSSRTVEGVVEVLRSREDLDDKEQVIKKFISAATKLVAQMKSDGVSYNINIR